MPPTHCKAWWGSLMVWGCISYNGVGRLLRVHGKANAEYYQKVLKFCMLPSSKHLYPSGRYIFMQDNAPIHTARINQDFLEANGVDVLPWPGQSPDLNPIENLWRYMKVRLQGKRFSNTNQLFQELETIWTLYHGHI